MKELLNTWASSDTTSGKWSPYYRNTFAEIHSFPPATVYGAKSYKTASRGPQAFNRPARDHKPAKPRNRAEFAVACALPCPDPMPFDPFPPLPKIKLERGNSGASIARASGKKSLASKKTAKPETGTKKASVQDKQGKVPGRHGLVPSHIER
ncbi:hypothetical protein B9479_006500 [Cryptococcus floricola]|uniref:Uncharacterized protein n=1 Tax=Cryptococcus floricola TaxID=2591691 RepID=A0A5D3AN63_9TREE|nr:hypothetical protein B9479_006500 [Cryptococcus floricola]